MELIEVADTRLLSFRHAPGVGDQKYLGTTEWDWCCLVPRLLSVFHLGQSGSKHVV